MFQELSANRSDEVLNKWKEQRVGKKGLVFLDAGQPGIALHR